ncbi:MAG TPA: methyltransferase domain-containing protein [Candidatus Wunengus sp. YC60]|uniref:methyltransferase domain-containing protein n=1 Tax=Candidatus Wunengus sp. YC60 TaxID=3367697 RepID=UPI0040281487
MSVLVKNSTSLKVLYIPLEFKTWQNASHFPYPGNYGFEEGFASNGVEFLTIPAIYETTSSEQTSWLNHARELCAGKDFDQVWLEIVHSRFDEDFLDWTTTIAPVRIGFIWESWEMHPDELVNNPEGAKRRRTNLEKNLKFVTHVVAIDEKDVEKFNAHGLVKAKWLWDAGIVPERFICKELPPTPATNNFAVFYGALYGERKKWLEHSALKSLLVRPAASPEYTTNLPGLFDKLNATSESFLKEGNAATDDFFSTYIDSLRVIRRECFAIWLKGLSMGAAIVNLPQFGKGYASRVLEGMAAGRPVISCEIPDRPRTKALFEDGKEILLYKGDNPYQLAEHIQRVLREPDFARRISANARSKIKSFHTTERLVNQILDWVENNTTSSVVKKGTSLWKNKITISDSHDCLSELRKANLWSDNHPLHLHLGCGEQHLDGYINIDYPPTEHNVMQVKADVYANVTELDFPPGSVDEIRLHHVFEHFSRVTALAMLIKWHNWLKIGGKLYIETPDLVGSAKTLLAESSWKTKMGVVRHIAGDQSSDWAYHIDHWFPERFEYTLNRLGFIDVQTQSNSWPHEPFLSNVTAIAVKSKNVTITEQLAAAEELLWESTVSPSEQPTFEIWEKQLRSILLDNQEATPHHVQSLTGSQITSALRVFQQSGSELPLDELHNFNQRDRDRWVHAKALTVPAGSHVLDIGAGTCPYRPLFAHCVYKTHDFKRYTGEKLGGTKEYGIIDYESDICAIPVPDNSFDIILCTEVLEHTPEPIEAMREIARILRPGGRLFITAPLGAGLHQLPYHYYGGYTPEWYRHFCKKFGLYISEIIPNGGFFKLLAQECARVAWTLPQHQHLHGNNVEFIQNLFGEWIPRYLFALEEKHFNDQFTVGYHVEAVKVRDTDTIQKMIDKDTQNVNLYIEAARTLMNQDKFSDAKMYIEDALELDYNNPTLLGIYQQLSK